MLHDQKNKASERRRQESGVEEPDEKKNHQLPSSHRPVTSPPALPSIDSRRRGTDHLSEKNHINGTKKPRKKISLAFKEDYKPIQEHLQKQKPEKKEGTRISEATIRGKQYDGRKDKHDFENDEETIPPVEANGLTCPLLEKDASIGLRNCDDSERIRRFWEEDKPWKCA